MKKLILISIMLLFACSVLAKNNCTISIGSNFDDYYNLGETVLLSGDVSCEEGLYGLLSVMLSCENKTMQVGAMLVSVTKEFSFEIPTFADMIGNCKLELEVKDFNNTLLGTDTTPNFVITQELVGEFQLNKEEFQLGDNLKLQGTITTLKDKLIEGSAIVYLQKNSTNYVVGDVEIVDGKLSYETQLSNLPAGEYSIAVDVFDKNGNRFLFEDAEDFTLYNELVISAVTDKESYLPGEVLKLEGSINKKTGPSCEADVDVVLENETYSTQSKDGKFVVYMNLAKDIKSYYHSLKIIASDGFGNSGEKELKFEIIPVPTRLEVQTDKQEYMPGDVVVIKANLYDQANDPLIRKLSIKIKNPKGKVVYEKENLTTSQDIPFGIEQFSLPGEWKIEASAESLKAESKFIVKEYSMLDINLVNQELIFTNLGNIPYQSNVEIFADNMSVTKKLNLKPNESVSFMLYKLFKPGSYIIKVLNKEFPSVTIVDERSFAEKLADGLAFITGYATIKESKGKAASVGYLICLGIGLLLLGFLGYKIGKKITFKKKPDHVKRKIQARAEIKKPVLIKKESVSSGVSSNLTPKEEAAAFRKRVLASINKKDEYSPLGNEKSKSL